MGEDIVLIGGGGHCKACIDVIEAGDSFKIAGIVDLKERKGVSILGYRIFACDEELPLLAKEYRNFLIVVGQMGTYDKRRHLFNVLEGLNAHLPAVISPYAHVSKHAEIGDGTIVMHGAFVSAGVRVGKNCILNTGSIVEHDATIGDHCHVSTSSIVNGECRIGEGVFLGSNSVISNNVSITGKTLIGAGSVVIRSIEESGTYAGVPAGKIG